MTRKPSRTPDSTPPQDRKSGRLAMRVDEASKALLEEAAALEGLSVTAFVLRHATLAARDVVDQYSRLQLSHRDWDHFLDLLDNPPEPADSLRRAAKRHRELIQGDE